MRLPNDRGAVTRAAHYRDLRACVKADHLPPPEGIVRRVRTADAPTALLNRRFVSDDGRLALTLRLADASSAERARYPLVATVERADGSERLLSAAPAAWIPRKDEHAKEASRRLDRVQVELGPPGIGETYILMLARPSDDGARWHGYSHVALRDDTPVEEVAIFPEHGGTPYGGDDWDWQEGWWYPYSTYRVAPDPPAPQGDG